MVRVGVLVGGALMVLVAILLLSIKPHWFSVLLLMLGLIAMILAYLPAPEIKEVVVDQSASRATLASKLDELDALLADGHLTKAEHKAQRKALLDAWAKE